MSAAQVLRQAEALKVAAQDTSRGANEAWVSRQHLQDLYQKLLVLDLEYALDKKVEQDLWNHAFKNQINTLQTQAKDKQNPKRPEILASLNLFLETASGFYIQLLEELCSAFKLDLPCRRKASTIGILKEYGPVAKKIRPPKKTSCLYICQHCLVHLGDIARYREESDQAQTYYRHAAILVPYNGQPYNQLAILEAAKGNKLSTVVYYVRSIAVKHPFPVASTNLEKLYNKITRDIPDTGRRLSMNELITAFLQFNALVHLSHKLEVAKTLSHKIESSLPSHITSMSFSCIQLIHLVTISLFSVHHASRRLNQSQSSTEKEAEPDMLDDLALEEKRSHDLVFNMTVSILDMLLQLTPKQETKAKEYHTLPSIKVLLDWIRTDSKLINAAKAKMPSICQNLSKLLNNLQFSANQKDVPNDPEKYESVPLPEDSDLRCFLPLLTNQSDLDHQKMIVNSLSPELEMRIRCQRLIQHGLWLAEAFPSLNLLNVQKQKSGRLYFSCPMTAGKASTGTDPEPQTERKTSHRQNVAIQAIMQNKAKKEPQVILSSDDSDHGNKPNTSHGNHINTRKSPAQTRREKPEKSAKKTDASIMAHSATDTDPSHEKTIPPDAWAKPTLPPPYMDWPRPAAPRGPYRGHDGSLRPTWPPQVLQHNPVFPNPNQGDQERFPFQGPDHPQGRCHPSQDHSSQGYSEGPASQHQASPGHEKEMDDPAVVSFVKSEVPRMMGNIPVEAPRMIGNMQFYNEAKNVPGLRPGGPGMRPNLPRSQNVQTMRLQKTPDQLWPSKPYDTTSATFQQRQRVELEAQINETVQQLEQVERMIQEKSQAIHTDTKIHALRQQQRHLQEKQSHDPHHNTQIKVLTEQCEIKITAVVQHYHEQLQQYQLLHAQLQAKLSNSRNKLTKLPVVSSGHTWPDNISDIPSEDRLPSNNLPSDPLPSSMDLNQVMAVLQMIQGNQGNQEKLWLPRPGDPSTTSSLPTEGVADIGAHSDQSPTTPFWLGEPNPFGDRAHYDKRDDRNSLVSGSFQTSTRSTDGAFIPSSDSEEELRQVHEHSTYSDKSSLLLSPNFPVSLHTEFSQEVQKPDTPITTSTSSLYNNTTNVSTTNTYSLFSQSPWTVQLTSTDNKSHQSSPFGSGDSSLRTTPDPYISPEVSSTMPGLSYNQSEATETLPGLGVPYNYSPDKPVVPPTSIQTMWPAGPSPLQKLLQQQKTQRQNDPH